MTLHSQTLEQPRAPLRERGLVCLCLTKLPFHFFCTRDDAFLFFLKLRSERRAELTVSLRMR